MKIITALFALFSFLPSYSQIERELWKWEPIDTTIILCQYEYSHYVLGRKNKEDLLLQVGKHLSKTYSYKSWQYDSIWSTPQGRANNKKLVNYLLNKTKEKESEDEKRELLSAIPSYGTQTIVYKGLPSGRVLVQDCISNEYYKYTEDLVPQEWDIAPDTTVIIGYPCQKATCEWRGRNYIAWFTEQIPLSEGPMKFCGLPGLIMKLEDTEQEYTFIIKGLETSNHKAIYLNKPCNDSNGMTYNPVERKELLQRKWKRDVNRIRMLNKNLMQVEATSDLNERQLVEPMELDFK